MSLWLNEYRKKLTTPDEAVKVIKSGDWVDYGSLCSQVVSLDKALAKRKDELEDINIWSLLHLYPSKILEVDPKCDTFTWNSWHLSGLDRKIAASGRPVYYSPMRYSELPRYVREHINPINVAMLQVSPMDKHGFFNFGPQNSASRAVCDRAELIIVEINNKMPRCLGGYHENIHVSEVDYIVEGENQACIELPAGIPSKEDQMVAAYIMEDIKDGCCIQLGIGGMPNAVGMQLAQSDLKDLGCHTEMLVDSYVDIYEAGKLTGKYKSINYEKMVYSFALGSKRVYDFVHDNPICAIYPVDYTNNPRNAARNDNLITINNAIEIDLYGQICSESSGTHMISGTGGQLDFVLAGYLSQGGKSFICLPSCNTGENGELISRIVPTLPRGSIVTDPRSIAHIVVSEYGKCELKGKTVWQRTEGLISLAHPSVRDELIKSAQDQGIWRKSNKLL